MIIESTNPWNFNHSFTQLPSGFFSEQSPTPVAKPALCLFNETLAQDLGLDFLIGNESAIISFLSGNSIPPGAYPIAQAYAGHQFGHFTMLGDGRAILLGEVISPDQRRFDLQLKGAGPTPYSRRGDGRATLPAMLREFIMSEAMHYLGIPSSRSLAVVSTGEPVYREVVLPGAVLTRIMSSHIRIGSFEYAQRFTTPEYFRVFFEYTLNRHYPHLLDQPEAPLLFLEEVMNKQIQLVVSWLRVGFIHGVLNTDNISIAGETFDYGPCAFMNTYHPQTVFSSIDTNGRYAFDQQAGIIYWNLGILAGALLPLIDANQNKAIESVRKILDLFEQRFHQAWTEMMLAKTGITDSTTEDVKAVFALLNIMEKHRLDYTDTFHSLRHYVDFSQAIKEDNPLLPWIENWRVRLKTKPQPEKVMELLSSNNPVYIPRNHWVEEVLAEAIQGNKKPLEDLLVLIRNPYHQNTMDIRFSKVPDNFDKSYRTFCGT